MTDILRVVRCSTISVQPSEGSVRRKCSRCTHQVWVWNRSLAVAPDYKLICDVCLPSEPVGPIGAP